MYKKNVPFMALITILVQLTGCVSHNTNKLNNENKVTKVDTTAKLDKDLVLKQQLPENITLAIQQALANNDYRLFHSKSRRIVIPGLEQLELSLLKSQCGLKPMMNTGDVIKSKEQGLQRKAHYAYAKQFNQTMYAICLENAKI